VQKVVATLAYPLLLGVIIAGFGVGTATTGRMIAKESTASETIATVYEWQQQHEEFDRTLPELLVNSDGIVKIPVGAEVAYRVSESGKDYVFAQSLGESVVVASNTHRYAVKCDHYDAACISQVTSDPTLVNAIPLWNVPTGERNWKPLEQMPKDLKTMLPNWALDFIDSLF
jgi:hypothetical protein